jgi:hypothetical protein
MLTACLNITPGAFASSPRLGLVCDGTWHYTSSERPPGDSYYFGVAPVSSSLAWAVGGSYRLHKTRSVIERWDGAGWKMVAAPTVGRSDLLLGAAAPDAGHAFAAGAFVKHRRNKPLIEQFDGATWSVASLPHVGRRDASLSGVAALSGSDA